jgi:hypothetical protein
VCLVGVVPVRRVEKARKHAVLRMTFLQSIARCVATSGFGLTTPMNALGRATDTSLSRGHMAWIGVALQLTVKCTSEIRFADLEKSEW